MEASMRWGVELNGALEDKGLWKKVLKPPFDPYVEEVSAAQAATYLALRSTAFNKFTLGSEVHEAAETLFRRLTTAMASHFDADPVTPGAVVDFAVDGVPKRHHYLKAEGITLRIRIGHPELTVRDSQGHIIPQPSAPSAAQRWVRAATQNASIGAAIDYLAGKPSWVELYKAHEVLRDTRLAPDAISASELKRFTHTANTEQRHRLNKFEPPAKPMAIWEARALLTTWLEAVVAEALQSEPQSSNDT